MQNHESGLDFGASAALVVLGRGSRGSRPPPLSWFSAAAAAGPAVSGGRGAAPAYCLLEGMSTTYIRACRVCLRLAAAPGAGFAPPPLALAALCAPAAPLLDATHSWLGQPVPALPRALTHEAVDGAAGNVLAMLEVLLRSPFPGAEAALGRVLTPARVARATALAVAVALAEEQRAARVGEPPRLQQLALRARARAFSRAWPSARRPRSRTTSPRSRCWRSRARRQRSRRARCSTRGRSRTSP
jgi:hypothetical protein